MSPNAPKVAILSLHKVGEPSVEGWYTWNYVSQAKLREFLQVLREEGWAFIDHASFIEGLTAPERLPPKSALVTFDDAYRSVLTDALPVLREFDCPAVVFVPVGLVGGWNDFDKDIEPTEAICSWDDLRKLQAGGVSAQAHGIMHQAMSGLSEAEVMAKLATSKAVLERKLDASVELFAYPYGDANHPALTQALFDELGYRAAFLYGGGVVEMPPRETHRITRLALGPDSDLRAMLAE
ncbi:MAG: polysaccharide deacetylase family protein [Caulobacteraceae bacterium]